MFIAYSLQNSFFFYFGLHFQGTQHCVCCGCCMHLLLSLCSSTLIIVNNQKIGLPEKTNEKVDNIVKVKVHKTGC